MINFENKAEINKLVELDKISFSDHDAFNLETFDRFIKNKNIDLVAAKNDDNLIGYIMFFKLIDELDILSIAVSPDHRKQGLGSDLLSRLSLVGNQFKRAVLEVRESNSSAINFYKHNGFTEISKRLNYYQDPIENAIVMEKFLTNDN